MTLCIEVLSIGHSVLFTGNRGEIATHHDNRDLVLGSNGPHCRKIARNISFLAPAAIIATGLNDEDARVGPEQTGQPVQHARGRVTRNSRISNTDMASAGIEHVLQLRRESLSGWNTIMMGATATPKRVAGA